MRRGGVSHQDGTTPPRRCTDRTEWLRGPPTDGRPPMEDEQDRNSRPQGTASADQATNAPLAIGLERLTARQQRLLRLLVSGATASEVATRLGLSVGAVRRGK